MAKGKSGNEIKPTGQSACYIHPRHQSLIVCDPSCRTFAKIIVCINSNGCIRVAGTQPNMSNNSYAEWKMLKHVPFQFNDRKGHGNMAAKLHCSLLKLQSAHTNYIKLCHWSCVNVSQFSWQSWPHLQVDTCILVDTQGFETGRQDSLGTKIACLRVDNWHHHHKKGIFNAWQSLVQIMSATALCMSNYSIGTALWWVTRDPKSLQAITVACPNTLAPMR